MTSQMSPSRPIHQPLHPDIRPLLDPEYTTFHEKYLQYVLPDERKTWDGSVRSAKPAWPSTESPHTPVGHIQDLKLGDSDSGFEIRIFKPRDEQDPPHSGRPVFLWFHGGGWAIGGINDNNDLCTLVCDRAKCIVISVGYRLAPENPYPAAVEDAVTALQWVVSPEGEKTVGTVDVNRIAVGGLSAGGNLATVLSMKAAMLGPPIQICFQLLVVPVIDNTAAVDTIWAGNRYAPWLTPSRMEWYRRMYLPEYYADIDSGKIGQLDWDASPNLAASEILALNPSTFVAVAGQDLLAPEARSYARQMEEASEGQGIKDRRATVKVYEGATHSILAMSGVLKQGAQLLNDCADQVAAALA
ncbi:Alpha/Beta hydrolase protein [Aspergillus crustosus]